MQRRMSTTYRLQCSVSRLLSLYWARLLQGKRSVRHKLSHIRDGEDVESNATEDGDI
jgi:hypothetical protein